jgi:hypothetical protein
VTGGCERITHEPYVKAKEQQALKTHNETMFQHAETIGSLEAQVKE